MDYKLNHHQCVTIPDVEYSGNITPVIAALGFLFSGTEIELKLFFAYLIFLLICGLSVSLLAPFGLSVVDLSVLDCSPF